MAEIDIQKKQGLPIWPWVIVLLLLIAAVAIWALVSARDDSAPPTAAVPPLDAERSEVDQTAPADGAVEEYLEFARRPEPDEADAGAHHQYTNEGLQRLIAALDEVIQRDTVGQRPLEERLDSVRVRADRITTDPESPEHANQVREAFAEAADLIENIRDQRAPDRPEIDQQVEETRQAAESIDPATPLLDQRESVRSYFRESAQALRRLNEIDPQTRDSL